MPNKETARQRQPAAKRAASRQHQQQQQQHDEQQQSAPSNAQATQPNATRYNQASSNVRRDHHQAVPPQTVKKPAIIRAERDEAKTLTARVFHSDPDSQMKDFIRNAATIKKAVMASSRPPKTPAESHPPQVERQLLESDDEVADNLDRLFSKTSNTTSKSKSD